jgi:putative peptidoglycan lipid II flippase
VHFVPFCGYSFIYVNWIAVLSSLCFFVAKLKHPNNQIDISTHIDTQEAAGESTHVIGEGTGDFPTHKAEEGTGRSALLVGTGILISRIVGVIRQRVFAHYLGTSDAAGAFSAAFRIPNFLQNVFGEGALSASFIPVYAKLLAGGDKKEATRVANAVLTLLVFVTSVIVLVGVLTTPYFVDLFAYSFNPATRALTIRLVQILFPGAGLLVLSAWCLGVLNSHRKFFLSYIAPVAWNLAIITTLFVFGGGEDQSRLAIMVAVGSVVGSVLQIAVQFPTVLKLLKSLRPVIDTTDVNVRKVLTNFIPVFVSRGVVQISAFVDAMLAGLISSQAVAALTYAQSLYTLPVSLFGMSVSAAELPAMSGTLGTQDEIAVKLRSRLNAGLQRISFFIVPSSMAMFVFGDVMTGALYQTGEFKHADSVYVWGILAGSTIGLLASTHGRLYSSTYYALHDTRTPLWYAIIRVILTTVLGYIFAITLPPVLGLDPKWGVAGLTASAGIAGWIEYLLLRHSLNARIGSTGVAAMYLVKLWTAAAIAAVIGFGLKWVLPPMHAIPLAILVLGTYGVLYFATGAGFGVPEARRILKNSVDIPMRLLGRLKK